MNTTPIPTCPAYLSQPPSADDLKKHREAFAALRHRRDGNLSAESIRHQISKETPYEHFFADEQPHEALSRFTNFLDWFAPAIERHCIAFSLAIIVAVIVTTGGILPEPLIPFFN